MQQFCAGWIILGCMPLNMNLLFLMMIWLKLLFIIWIWVVQVLWKSDSRTENQPALHSASQEVHFKTFIFQFRLKWSCLTQSQANKPSRSHWAYLALCLQPQVRKLGFTFLLLDLPRFWKEKKTWQLQRAGCVLTQPRVGISALCDFTKCWFPK